MKVKPFIGALLCCAAACALAQVPVLDLSEVDLSGFSLEGSGTSVKLSDGSTIEGVTYSYSKPNYGSSSTPTDVRHLLIGTDVVLTGTATAFGLKAAADVTVTLRDATVAPAGYFTKNVGGLSVETFTTGTHTVTLVLEAGTTNTFIGSPSVYITNDTCHAGLTVPTGGTLIIQSESTNPGKLIAQAGVATDNSVGAAGLGADKCSSEKGFGHLIIEGGIVEAIGGPWSAGIGEAYVSGGSSAGSIEIKGGQVTATGGSCGAGIGSCYDTLTPAITISGGEVTTYGGDFCPAIGCAYGATPAEKATISGGTVKAYGGAWAAAIGGGYNVTSVGEVEISGAAKVVAEAGYGAPYAIGAGYGATEPGATLTVAETASVDTRGGDTPLGILGATLVDVANKTIDPAASGTVEGNVITVTDSTKALILSGTGAEVEVVVPDGVGLFAPSAESYAVEVKSLQCEGTFTLEGNNTFTVGTLSGALTVIQRSGTEGMTLTVSEMDAADKVTIQGRNAVTLPAVANVGDYGALASITTTKEEEGKFPRTISGEALDLTGITANTILPNDWSVTPGNYLLTLSAPAGAKVVQSGSELVSPISIEAAGDLTIEGVNFSSWAAGAGISLTNGGTLTLVGENVVGSSGNEAAIRVPESKTVTISGSGTLKAESGGGAAIGGDRNAACGTVVIDAEGGTVVAVSEGGAAIGCGYAATSSGSVTIKAGTVAAISQNGAGIGMGSRMNVDGTMSMEIGIEGGKILAFSATGAGIGSGLFARASTTAITISGSPTVVACGNVKPEASLVAAKLGVTEEVAAEWLEEMIVSLTAPGAAIGGGQNACFGQIKILGGDITALSTSGAAIGGGKWYANVPAGEVAERTAADTILISGENTQVVAKSVGGAAIGAGASAYANAALGSIVIEDGATVEAATEEPLAAAIGGSLKTGVKSITIADKSKVNAASFGSGSLSQTVTEVKLGYPASEGPVRTESDGTHTLVVDKTKAVADAMVAGETTLTPEGDSSTVVAKITAVSTAEGTKTTLTVVDPALKLSDQKAALITKQRSDTNYEEVLAKAWLLNAALTFTDEEGVSHDLEYAYEFGIQGMQIGAVSAAGVEVTRVEVGLKEGTQARTATLNGFLTVWAGDVPIFEVEKPSFSNGVYIFQSGTTPPVVQISAESRMVALKVTLQDSAQMASAE